MKAMHAVRATFGRLKHPDGMTTLVAMRKQLDVAACFIVVGGILELVKLLVLTARR